MDDATEDLTSAALARVVSGDAASLEEVVTRFSPYLLFQARKLCGEGGVDLLEPEDLVAETWVTAIPRLPDLVPREGRLSPVVMGFLATTLLHLHNNARRRKLRRELREPGSAMERVWDSTRGAITRVAQAESARRLVSAMRSLSDQDQEILLLVGLQQQSPSEVAESLGVKWESARRRYTRAVARLREELGSPLLELP